MGTVVAVFAYPFDGAGMIRLPLIAGCRATSENGTVPVLARPVLASDGRGNVAIAVSVSGLESRSRSRRS